MPGFVLSHFPLHKKMETALLIATAMFLGHANTWAECRALDSTRVLTKDVRWNIFVAGYQLHYFLCLSMCLHWRSLLKCMPSTLRRDQPISLSPPRSDAHNPRLRSVDSRIGPILFQYCFQSSDVLVRWVISSTKARPHNFSLKNWIPLSSLSILVRRGSM